MAGLPAWPGSGPSAITTVPVPPERTHLMLGSRAAWAEPRIRKGDRSFDEYPEESIAAWHERLGLADLCSCAHHALPLEKKC